MKLEELLKSLQESSSTKVKETLNTLFTVCMEQKERGVNDYSYATIARLGAGRGVPKAQSIRNKTGEKYQALIQAFVDDAANLPNNKNISKKELDWIEEIQNPKHKLLAKIMASELKEAQRIVDELIPPGQRIEVFDYKNVSSEQKEKNYRLTGQEERALTYLLSDEFLKKWSFKTTQYGEVLDSKGNAIFKAATTDAIRKALVFLT